MLLMKKPLKPHIALVFLPVLNQDDQPVKYDIYLMNTLPYVLEFSLNCCLYNKSVWVKNDVVGINETYYAGSLQHQSLNDRPDFILDLELWDSPLKYISTYRIIRKVRARSFHANIVDNAFHNREGIYYVLLDKLKTKPAASLRELQILKERKRLPANKQSEKSLPEKRAHFSNEIDLHIEKLIKPGNRPGNQHILDIQIRAFERYLNRAILLQIPIIYIIHGEGKGILRDHIHRILREDYPDFEFVNQYHHKYGFGATEIRLK